MGTDKQDRSREPDGGAPPDPGDIADAAQIQMPGKPPNLAFDPGKRNKRDKQPEREQARAEGEELSGKYKE